jgi:hypothetical protein
VREVSHKSGQFQPLDLCKGLNERVYCSQLEGAMIEKLKISALHDLYFHVSSKYFVLAFLISHYQFENRINIIVGTPDTPTHEYIIHYAK